LDFFRCAHIDIKRVAYDDRQEPAVQNGKAPRSPCARTPSGARDRESESARSTIRTLGLRGPTLLDNAGDFFDRPG
jgi:hypothetical protein